MLGWSLVDAAGVEHPPAKGEARIVSLVPSITELLFDLGLGPQVVGRTRFCVHPRGQVDCIQRVGGTKGISIDRVRSLAPTHVIVNVDENTQADFDAMANFVPHLIVTHPIEPWDNLQLYRLLGGIFGKRTEAEHLCTAFQRAYDALADVAGSLPQQRVLYLIWKSPWMTVSKSTYISRMLALVNWETIGHDPVCRYPPVEFTERLFADADIIFFSSEPYPFKRRHIEAFRTEFSPVRSKLALIDGEMTAWYGSRAIQGLGYLRSFAPALLVQGR